jgi:hypothetical protein
VRDAIPGWVAPFPSEKKAGSSRSGAALLPLPGARHFQATSGASGRPLLMRRWVTAAFLLTAACTTGTHPALPSGRPTASPTMTPIPTTFRPPTELQLILQDQAVDGSAVLSLVELCKGTCTTRLYRSTNEERTLGRRSELPQTITRIAAAGATGPGRSRP